MSANKIKTPILPKSLDYEEVYEPAEDSFLMLDALEKELDSLRSLNPLLCLEIGSGSGILSTGLATVMKETNCAFMCTDVNPVACAATKATARENGVDLTVVRTNGVDGLLPFLKRVKVDIVLCNPPYVATVDEEADKHDLSAAWAGGDRGMNLTSRVLELLPEVLSEVGACYMVVEQCNKPREVEEFAKSLGLEHSCVLQRKAGRELLSIYKFFNRNQ